MNYKKKILKNGLRIVAVTMKNAPSVTVMSLVEAGSEYEEKKYSGISHFLEHMCFKGTEKRPKSIDISREFDSLGAEHNAFTSQELTGYWGKAHKKHLNKILDIIADMYIRPTFPSNDLETEKGVIIEEINMYQDLPQRLVHEVYDELLYGDQPAGRSIAGTKESISAFKRDDFINYRKQHYVASATTIVIAGDIVPKTIFQKIEKAFKEIATNKKEKKNKVVEKQKGSQVALKFKETDQTHIVIGARTFDMYSKKMPTLKVLSVILGNGMSSRLFQKMREELGICYYVRSGINDFTDHGSLTISAGVDSNRVDQGIQGILDEIKKLRNVKVPEQELRKAKDYLIGNMYLALESSDGLAHFYGGQEIFKQEIKTPKQIEAEIEKVSVNDVCNLAKEIFINDKLNLAIVGKFKDDQIFKQIFHV